MLCKKNFTIALLLIATLMIVGQDANAESKDTKEPEWKVAVQTWSFNRYMFYDAIEKAESIGLKYMEAFPGQRLSKEKARYGMLPNQLPPEQEKEVKQKLKDAGIKLINYGVVNLANDEAKAREYFEFAKMMGIETIVSEPEPEAMEMLDRLCNEYKIKLAIHNHPKPSRYWHPEKVLQVCKGRSKWIGACADTGHWIRSGIDPVAGVKMLEGRLISLHLKDINKGEGKEHDVIWGTGKSDIKAILVELKRQDFKGVFSIEYEYNWHNSVPDIRQCVEYFNSVVAGFDKKCCTNCQDKKQAPSKAK
jgi:sugar phosphate isomerase/epimerase